jgi:hypothetical protein
MEALGSSGVEILFSLEVGLWGRVESRGFAEKEAILISNLMPEIPPPRKLRLVGPREELRRLCDHAEYRCLREAQLWSSCFSLADLSDSRKSQSIPEDDGSNLVGEHMISTR